MLAHETFFPKRCGHNFFSLCSCKLSLKYALPESNLQTKTQTETDRQTKQRQREREIIAVRDITVFFSFKASSLAVTYYNGYNSRTVGPNGDSQISCNSDVLFSLSVVQFDRWRKWPAIYLF